MRIQNVPRARVCECEAYPFCEHAANATAGTMTKVVGKLGTVNQGGLHVDVKVLDVKQSYGCLRYLVTPIAGSGEIWVDATRANIQQNEVKA